MSDETANLLHSQELPKRRLLRKQDEHHPDKVAADDAHVNPSSAAEGLDRILKATQTENYYLRRLLETCERDRRMVAYDIHDGIGQLLIGATMIQEEVLSLQKARDFQAAQEMSNRILQMLRTAIKDVRRLAGGERPGNLDRLGLVAALQQLVTEGQEQFGVQCEFAENIVSMKLPAPVETVIFRVAQEALMNALRHSNSPTVLVTLSKRGGKICVKVEDWGVGFDVKAAASGGFGLEGIRQRARLFGGRVGIRSSPGRGTLVKVEVPVQERRRKMESANKKGLNT
jgi:signal transduction histidine kinase